MTQNGPASAAGTVSIIGTGAYLPEKILSNKDLEAIVDTTDEWIYSRTGMKERRIAGEQEASSDMAARASERALEDAGVAASEIDLILVATSTPDMFFPSTACLVQDRIGAKGAFCFDLSAACSGFLYAMSTAEQFLKSGTVKTALVIGAEKMSGIVDWTDRTTCVLFGDGAGAAVLRLSGDRGKILATNLGADGSLGDLLKVPAGGSRLPADGTTLAAKQNCIRMEGRDVFKHAVKNMAEAAQQVMADCGVHAEDIDCIIPHQANARIIQAIAKKLNAPMERFFINVEKYGNTSAASVIVALDEAVKAGRVKKGDRVLLVVFGAGFTWGASIVEW